MRVAHIITRLILGGAQENTLFTCEDLRSLHGDDVLLITGPALGPEGSLIDRAKRSGVPLAVIDSLRRSIHLGRDWAAYRAIRREISRFQPDVVHTHSAKAGILGREAAWRLRVPAIVHTVHGAPFYPYQPAAERAFYRLCERHAARRCHALVSVADAMTDLMVDNKVAPREKFTTIYSGMEVEPLLRADESKHGMRGRLGYSPEHVVVGKIARLFDLKGHEFVIAAAKEIIAKSPSVRFLLVGDGILRESMQREIDRQGLAPFFHFAGLVPPEEIPAYLGAMDIVVHASLREGLARVLPQALIAGKPVVSFDVDGAREVVIPGETGFLIAPRDVAGLAASVAVLAADPGPRATMGNTGRERFTDQFRHERMTAALRDLYARVLQRRFVVGSGGGG
jgi:glycosyltransferase involved in cell wall biosynthesis